MHDLINNKLSRYSNQKAIIDNDKEYTYNDLLNNINVKLATIRPEIQPGEIVILKSDYTFHGISALFALAINRNIIVPVPEKVENEIPVRTKISGATKQIYINGEKVVVNKITIKETDNTLILKLRESGHPGIILFSSGITGQPKAMVHDLHQFLQPFFLKKSKSLNFMALLLFDHIGGINTLFTALFSGAVLTIPPSNDPDIICAQSERHRVNILPASPTMLNLILISGAFTQYDLKSIKIITYGTEPMPEGLLHKLNQAFPGVRFMQTYGTSETGISKMSSKSSTSLRVKFEDPDTEYKIVDGELWIRTSTTIMGYLNAEMDKFTEDRWFKTGDLVEQDEEGYLFITGRNNEIINVGGLKVLPQEVESVLMKIPFIENCIVYGEKSPITGNIVASDIQLSHNKNEIEARSEIKQFCRDNLERYKIPVKIKFVDNIRFNDRFKKIRK